MRNQLISILVLQLTLIAIPGFSQYLGGSDEGYCKSSVCTDLNNTPTSFVVGTIAGNADICPNGFESYSLSLTAGVADKFYWTVPNGATVVSGQGTSSVTIQFGTTDGTISISVYNDCQVETINYAVTFMNCSLYQGGYNDGFVKAENCTDLNGASTGIVPDIISGATSICIQSQENYSIALLSGAATDYQWTGPPGSTIVAGQGTNSVTVQFGDFAGNISVDISNGCNTITALPLSVTNNCLLYQGGTDDGYVKEIVCTDLNGVASSSGPLSITGSSGFCANSYESFFASLGSGYLTSYYWTVPTGATIVSGQGTSQILVLFGSLGGDIDLTASDGCSQFVSNMPVSPQSCPMYGGSNDDGFAFLSTCTDLNGHSQNFVLNPISGFSDVCEWGTETYSISLASGTATTYFWTVPTGASIISGQGSNRVLVAIGANDGNIQCEVSNTCYNDDSDPLYILPQTCSNYLGDQNDGHANIAGCTDLNGNSMTFSLNDISGSPDFCPYNSETYTLSLASGTASTYFWDVPSGSNIISGQGSNAINVNFGAVGGVISCTVSNACTTIVSNPLAVNPGSCIMYAGGVNDGFTKEFGCNNLNGAYTPLSLNAIAGPSSFCPYGVEQFSISVATGIASTFYWTVPSDATVISGQGTNTVSVQFGTLAGDVSVDATNGCETVSSAPLALSPGPCVMYSGGINDGYTADNACTDLNGTGSTFTLNSISGISTVCPTLSETFTISTATGYASSFFWNVPSGATVVSGQGSTSALIQFGVTAGDVYVDVSNVCQTITSAYFPVTIGSCPMFNGGINDGFSKENLCTDLNGGSTGYTVSGIVGTTSPCINGEAQYTISCLSGSVAIYSWTVPSDATIISGQGSNTIWVRFGSASGDVSVIASDYCTETTETISVTLISCPMYKGDVNDGFSNVSNCTDLNGMPPDFTLNAITGNTTFCANTSENYSITLSSGTATDYTWSVPAGATITAGQGTSSITVLFGDIDGSINVQVSNNCSTQTAVALAVTNSCLLYNGGVDDGYSAEDGCNDLNGGMTALTLNSISGPTSFCNNSTETYSISPATGIATSYFWSVPTGATVFSGQGTSTVIIQFGSVAGNIQVEVSNGCQTVNSALYPVAIGDCTPYFGGVEDGYAADAECTDLDGNADALTISAINGSTGFCNYGSETYSVTVLTGLANSFTWTGPTASTISSGQNTNCSIITFATNGGNVIVEASNQCYTVTQTLAVAPDICGMYSGGTEDGFSKVLQCTDLDGNSSSFTLNSINGATSFCANGTEVYSISTASGSAQSYYWSIPADATLVSGQGTNTISVLFGSAAGTISVDVSDFCSTISSAPLAVSPMTCTFYTGGTNDGFARYSLCGDLNGSSSAITLNAISGTAQFCPFASESYTISATSGFVSSYYWSIPSGSSISSGQGSSAIIVSYGNTPGNITVEASNACETVTPSPLAVSPLVCTMYKGGQNDGFANTKSADDIPLPITLLYFSGETVDTVNQLRWVTGSEFNTRKFIIEKSSDGLFFFNMDSISAAGFSSAPKKYRLYDYYPMQKTYYRIKTVNIDNSFSFSYPIYIIREKAEKQLIAVVYPNPVEEDYPTLFIQNAPPEEEFQVIVYDNQGNKLFSHFLFSDSEGDYLGKLKMNSKTFLPGFYIITILSKESSKFIKIVVQ